MSGDLTDSLTSWMYSENTTSFLQDSKPLSNHLLLRTEYLPKRKTRMLVALAAAADDQRKTMSRLP